MTGDEREETGDEPLAQKGTRPNPLALGAVSLTLPGGGTTRAGAAEPEAPPAAAERDGDGQSQEASGGDDRASESDFVVADGQGQPGGGDGGTTIEGAGPQPGFSDVAAGDLAASFPEPVAGQRSPDRSVVTVLAAAAASVVVLGGSVWWLSRPEPPAAPPQLHPVVMPTGDAASSAAPAVAQDGPLPVTVETDCPGQTDPQLAASTDANSAWVCPTGGLRFGQQLVLTLPKPYVITGIKFWPGFQGQGADGGDEWYRHRLIKTAQVVFNDPDRTLVSLTPQGERRQYAKALNHILANQAVITIQDSAAPPPAPAPNATAVPSGADDPNAAPALPDLGSLFDTSAHSGDDGPQGSSVAMWGLQLIGHLP